MVQPVFFLRVFSKIFFLFAVFIISAAQPSYSQTLKEIQEKLKSLEACQISIQDKNCNLQILDADLVQTLKRLESLKSDVGSLRKQGSTGLNINSLSGNKVFFTDTISDATSEVLKLMGGSIWLLDQYYFGLSLDDVIGIMQDDRTAVIYGNGNRYSAELIRGSVLKSEGLSAVVIKEKADGRLLILDSGLILTFSSYDAYDTGWWLPPYEVLIDTSRMVMWNLKEGKKVWIESIE